MREAWGTVFVGIDHHSRQFTVSAATGSEFQANRGTRTAAWLPVAVFDQDGIGYSAFLEWLTEKFPAATRERFVFLCEPTFSKPLCFFLSTAGFSPERILWAKTTEVGLYRKAKVIGKAGKNDLDDARSLATMAFESATNPQDHRMLFTAAPHAPVAEGLRQLAQDHLRLSRQIVSVKNRITELVLRLFPECRRVWGRTTKGLKPDGSSYEQRFFNLFRSELPLRVLAAYPSAQQIAEAGFEALWRSFGGAGYRRKAFEDLVVLAQSSGGLSSALDSKRLQLLITEYQQIRQQIETYREAINEVLDADSVLSSLRAISYLGPYALATIIGELGDVSRYKDVDAVKRHLNVAPVALPQTGEVDERGRPVQTWRMSTNTYRRINGQRRLAYESPGIKTVREAAYLWFDIIVKCAKSVPHDPFVRLYQRLKEQHRGRPHWLGKVRWKVIAKMIAVIYHCLRKGEPYDPVHAVPQERLVLQAV